ncbi:hypothetical protein HDU67_002546, partial [Dinochytrium kinnereticum]
YVRKTGMNSQGLNSISKAHLTQLDSRVFQWIYDTGLSHEALASFKEDLEDSRPYSVFIDGTFAGNSSKAIGTVRGYSNLGHTFEFKALYVPIIQARLLSRNTLVERDIYLADGPGGSFLTCQGTELAEMIQSQNSLMVLSLSHEGPKPLVGFSRKSPIAGVSDFASFHADGQYDEVAIKEKTTWLTTLHRSLGHPSNHIL